MRVAVVGAGIAGLGSARTLIAGGHQVVVFESQEKPGGRIVTTALGPYVFDAGATSIAPLGHQLENVILQELPTEDLVKIEKPVSAHDGFRIVTGGLLGSRAARYCYTQGLAEVGNLLSAGIDVRLGTEIDQVEATTKETYLVNSEEFDAVIITAPIPVTEKLLAASKEHRRFSNVRFRSCLSVLLGFDQEFDCSYHALVGPDQSVPLAWISFESLKSPGRAPEGHSAFVAQLSAEYSKRRFDADDDLILGETLGDITRLLDGKFAEPAVSKVVRFRYSHPETTTAFESVNSPMSRLLVAGDGLIGGRTELAYESGVRAAKMLMEN